MAKKSPQPSLRDQVKEKLVGYLTAALGLVAGLAWNDAIKALIETLYPQGKNTLAAQFIYAVIMTILVVIISAVLVRIYQKREEN